MKNMIGTSTARRRMRGGIVVLVALALMTGSHRALAQSKGEAWENVVIDNGTGYWRVFFYWKTPQVIDDAGNMKPLLEAPDFARGRTGANRNPAPVKATQPPPESWFADDFDHTPWSRQTKTYGPDASDRITMWEDGNPTELAMICLRGEFEVIEPGACKDLQILLEYHGGAVVYINGKEVRRANLPEGDLTPDTLADKYDKDAYIKQQYKSIEPFRIRRLEVLIKPNMVRKGKNTVAIGVYRAPVHEMLDQPMIRQKVAIPLWSHAFVQTAKLHSGWGLTPKTVVRSADEPQAVVKKPGKDILNNKTGYWRVFTRYKTVELVDEAGRVMMLRQPPPRGGKLEDGKELPLHVTASPPAEWTQVEFDDTEWARCRGLFGPEWGFRSTVWSAGNPAALANIFLRGKFEVTDPAACNELQVALEYHGGVVVYVNGQEIKRAHLPQGPINLDTLAERYDKTAYVKADGTLLHSRFDVADYADQIRISRVRTLEASIPPNLLRKGTNVVAVETHRAPVNTMLLTGRYHKAADMGDPAPWAHALVLSASVRALRNPGEDEDTPVRGVVPNLFRPSGIQAWNERIVERIGFDDYGDPCEKLHPVRIVGVRNGSFCGHFGFGCTDPVEELKVSIGDLRSKEGAVIPASAVEISFPKPDSLSYEWGMSDRCETLWPEPPPKIMPEHKYNGATQPIWLKVRVPRDAKPGTYSATLTLNFQIGIRGINLKPATPVEVPVELTVYDWTLPPPQQFTTFMDIIQSPESVAMMFKVPQWSDAHWKYMEKSFNLLAEAGNKSVYLPLITRTHFGNSESILRFVRDKDGKLAPDFSIIDRYMELVERTQGKPMVVILYLWESYTCPPRGYPISNRAPMVTEFNPATGAAKEIEVPKFNTPEGKEFWGMVLKAVRENMAKRGLESALMLGIYGDWTQVPPESAKFFHEIAPGMPWVDQGHGLISSIGMGKGERVPVGYATTVWNARGPGDPYTSPRNYGWREKSLVCQFARDLRRGHPLFIYRTAPEWNITGYQRGMGRFGGDFWNVMKPAEKVVLDTRHSAGLTIVHRYPEHSDWAQLVVRTSFLACGRDGAIPSVHYEMLREGMQDCEARIFIEKALLDDGLRAKLGPEVAERAKNVLDERTWVMAHASRASSWFFDAGFTGWQHRLYSAAAEVDAALKKQ